ncbi:5'-3' exonuclease PLD3-like [Drosophila innubila]|uniref:5'-3' exonuclease PLD3-like n=1 Tax=Drosophila innubila TaxID=198719 RepID=UPI00148D7263|nr:5'-3' exonuclease PLD3-like [Drosophila innubila]XP_034475353.1 5'-3' exonuclease PLD3-like [Drosophila innubila]
MYKPQPLHNEDDDVENALHNNNNNNNVNNNNSGSNSNNNNNVHALQMCLLTAFLLIFLAGSAFQTKPLMLKSQHHQRDQKTYDCNLTLVESIPIGLNFTPGSPKFMSTFEAWQHLLNISKSTLDIGSYYWTLRGEDTGFNHSSAQPGEQIFQRLLANGIGDGTKIKIRIAQSEPSSVSTDLETKILASYGAAEVVTLDFPKYLGGGILHTKLWIVDEQHFYLGSANMDWRALTQVKELGVLGQNCPQLANDLAKIFKAYWYLGSNPNARIPTSWPWQYSTDYNQEQPMMLNVNRNPAENFTMQAYAASSPPPLSANGRTHDLDAILNTINTALKFVHISVMDYHPLILFGSTVQFWPEIDNALRKAAVERSVSVKLLISWWKHSDPSIDNFLRSLQDLSTTMRHIDIQIRRFIVPADEDQQKIPFGRVNHNKYMVTDRVAYIGTSNWSGDYFTDTAGIGLVLKDTNPNISSLRNDLQNIFNRDWNSAFAQEMS